MSTTRYTTDNTSGYNAQQLETLNAAASELLAGIDDKSEQDAVSERLLALFDDTQAEMGVLAPILPEYYVWETRRQFGR